MKSTAVLANPEPTLKSPRGETNRVVLRSIAEVKKIQALWRSLTPTDAAPFHTFSWNATWYRIYRDEFDEIMVFVDSARKVIFPFYRRGNELRLAGDTTCDYQDVVALEIDDVRSALPEMLAWAHGNGFDLDFQKISTEGILYQVLTERPNADDLYLEPLESPFGPCPYFRIPETPGAFLETLPRKFRAELRRQKRRVEADFPETVLEVREAPSIEPDQILAMSAFHREHFRRSGANPLDAPRFRQFLLEIRNQSEVGLCVSRLGNSDTTLAMDLTFVRGNRFYGFLTAFDGNHARYSPGSCLLVSRLDRLTSGGIEFFDFLCGSEPYKYRFAEDEYHVRSVRLIRNTGFGVCRLATLRAARRLRNTAKRIRDRIKDLRSQVRRKRTAGSVPNRPA